MRMRTSERPVRESDWSIPRSRRSNHTLTEREVRRSFVEAEQKCYLFSLASDRPLEDSSQLPLFENYSIRKEVHSPIYRSHIDWIVSEKFCSISVLILVSRSLDQALRMKAILLLISTFTLIFVTSELNKIVG